MKTQNEGFQIPRQFNFGSLKNFPEIKLNKNVLVQQKNFLKWSMTTFIKLID